MAENGSAAGGGEDRPVFRLGSMPIGTPATPATAPETHAEPAFAPAAGTATPNSELPTEAAPAPAEIPAPAPSAPVPAAETTSEPAPVAVPETAAVVPDPETAAAPSEPVSVAAPAPAEPAATVPPRAAPRGVSVAGAIGSLLVLLALVLVTLVPGLERLPGVPGSESATVELGRSIAAEGVGAALAPAIDPRASVGLAGLQAAVATGFGQGADAPLVVLRSISIAAVILAVALVFAIGWVLKGPFAGLVAGLFLALSLLAQVGARIAGPDAVVLLASVMALYGLAGIARGTAVPARLSALLFWGGLGLGLAVAGVGGIWIPLLAVLILVIFGWPLARLSRLRPSIGLPAALVIGLAPAVAVAVVAGLPAALQVAGGDVFARMRDSFTLTADGLPLPPGAHAVLLAGAFWPGSALLPFALAWLVRQRTTPAAGLALAWLAPAWIVAELMAGKRAGDVLPLYPVLALLLGLAAGDAALRIGSRLKSLMAAWLPIGAVGLAVAVNAVHVIGVGRIEPIGLGATFLGAAGTIAGWRALVAGDFRLGLTATALGAAVILAAGFGVLLWPIDRIWPAAFIAAAF
ncbi:ArnT family glycosyltransferase [Methylobrevis albus]|uniref:Glycosyltransferase RgtA/B/C/D-like domain-containing protein n=1 Tax=Methylobrevis albus TaxID=2793297 RepID=A0A931I5X0_9HYPH|nr:hypothetical protein [Methylobrevis albus]MBH0239866.1 hypothetical protein [Methylobrevis albus]